MKLYAERAIESCSDILRKPRIWQKFPGESDLAVPAHSIGENLRHAEINCRDVKAGRSSEEIDKINDIKDAAIAWPQVQRTLIFRSILVRMSST